MPNVSELERLAEDYKEMLGIGAPRNPTAGPVDPVVSITVDSKHREYVASIKRDLEYMLGVVDTAFTSAESQRALHEHCRKIIQNTLGAVDRLLPNNGKETRQV